MESRRKVVIPILLTSHQLGELQYLAWHSHVKIAGVALAGEDPKCSCTVKRKKREGTKEETGPGPISVCLCSAIVIRSTTSIHQLDQPVLVLNLLGLAQTKLLLNLYQRSPLLGFVWNLYFTIFPYFCNVKLMQQKFYYFI